MKSNKTQRTAIIGLILIAIVGTSIYLFLPARSGTIWYSVLVTYVDGSTETFTQPKVNIPSLSIIASNKRVASVTLNLNCICSTTKTVTAWSINGVQHSELYQKPDAVPISSSTINVNVTGRSWVSGTTIELLSTPIPASLIEGATQPSGSGAYFLQFTSSLSLTFQFSDGTSKTVNALGPTAGLDFNYYAGILSIVGNPATF